MNDAVDVEDAVSRKAQRDPGQNQSDKLYADRVKVHPRSIQGVWRRLKWAALVVLLAIYYIGPWLRWDRGENAPDQAILFDLAARKIYFFSIEIWPQEIYYITGLLVLAAVLLFLVTSMFGRVWCGYACPQTVWTDLYMLVERWIEGDRGARIALDKAPLSAKKVAKRTSKHAIWLIIAALTGGVFILYFGDAPSLVSEMVSGQSDTWTYAIFGILTAFTYLLAGMAREQVCTYMCPWPRFQSAMLDEDSLAVTYQKWRGEPRGKLTKSDDWNTRGDCVDCNQCVAVCPTGIDIRDGLQLECIGCALCIDACDQVMERVGRPKGLVTWTTERTQIACNAGQTPPKIKMIRPRTIIYGTILAIVVVAMALVFSSRATVEINVIRDRSPLFVTLSDGSIRNTFTFKILNMEAKERTFTLQADGLEGAMMTTLRNRDADPVAEPVLTAQPDRVEEFRLFVFLPQEKLESESVSFRFVLTDKETGEQARSNTVFRGPEQ